MAKTSHFSARAPLMGAFLSIILLISTAQAAYCAPLDKVTSKPMTTIAKDISTLPQKLKTDDQDPRAYLEEVEGEKSLAWVRERNEKTLARLTSDPDFATYQAAALKILEATDKIASPSFFKGGFIDNFWQGPDNKRGIWRRTTLNSYETATPEWETILDIDALSKSEGKNWVYKGASCLPTKREHCLVMLSNGGKDAVTVREFNIKTKSFVDNGFILPEGKQSFTWIDQDTLYVSREWVAGEVTSSGYAYVTKILKRGQKLEEAVEIFRGTPQDVWASRGILRDEDDNYVIDYSNQAPDFFTRTYRFYTKDGPVEFPLPLTTDFEGYLKGQAVFLLKSDFKSHAGTQFKAGQLISFDLMAGLKSAKTIEPNVIFTPTATTSIEQIRFTKNKLLINALNMVSGEVISYDFDGKKWQEKPLDLPKNMSISIGSTDGQSDQFFLVQSNFITPQTLSLYDLKAGTSKTVKSTPARFDAQGLEVKQAFATSKDGTKIPYFIVMKKGQKLDGTTPTLLYGYGGFEISLTPSYSGVMGKLWLEKGGAYVLANIRGGGEFGPSWHQAGLKTNRQRIYDDFQAVGEDVIRLKLTSPAHLGIMGGSNGGLLMGVSLTQRPELWNAVVIQVPLLDMLRFHKLLAGASWQGEYGSPDNELERAFLTKISPYHNLKAGVAYPEPFFVTSTKDDRVHPAHARKMAALMEEMGLPYYYYENIDGGHSAASNLAESAKKSALEYIYLKQKLK